MTPERLQALLDSFADRRIAVLGDFFLDRYLDVDPFLSEPDQDTGRATHQVIRKRRTPAAAGTIIQNLHALGATEIHALGAIGDDGDAYDLCRELEQLGCSTHGLLKCPELMTPTLLRPRELSESIFTTEHPKYESKNRLPTPSTITSHLAAALGHLLPNIDALVIKDHVDVSECGVVTTALREILTEQALRHPHVLFWADSRRHVRQFQRIITKPNQFEVLGRVNPLPGDEVHKTDLWAAISRVRAETQAPLFVSWGDHGMVISDPDPLLVPSVKVKGPFDSTGVSDSITAGAVLTLVSGGSHAEAALVGNLVAAITIRQVDTAGTASPDEVLEMLTRWREQYPNITISAGHPVR